MIKKTFVRLQRLLDITFVGETEESKAAWIANVEYTGCAEGYGFETGDTEDPVTGEFACEEFTFADDSIQMYNFAGSANGDPERFFVADIAIFKHKETSEYWVLHTEDLYEF